MFIYGEFFPNNNNDVFNEENWKLMDVNEKPKCLPTDDNESGQVNLMFY